MKKRKYYPGCPHCKTTKEKTDDYGIKKTYHCSECSHSAECVSGRALLGTNQKLARIMRGKP